MFKWSYSEIVKTDASPEQVWNIWTRVGLWPNWDHELSWAKLKGEFKIGTKGKMQLKSGQIIDFTLIEIEVNKIFMNMTKLPFADLYFSHEYKSYNDSSYIKHSIKIKGILAPLFGFLIGRKIKKHLRTSMKKLCILAKET